MNEYQKFESIYNSIHQVVPYSLSWANGTGYFNGICTDPVFENKGLYKSKDNAGRRIIIVSGDGGTVAFFERYNDRGGVLVVNTPHLFPVTTVTGANIDDPRDEGWSLAEAIVAVMTAKKEISI